MLQARAAASGLPCTAEAVSVVRELLFHGLHLVLCLWSGSGTYHILWGCSCSCLNVTHLVCASADGLFFHGKRRADGTGAVLPREVRRSS